MSELVSARLKTVLISAATVLGMVITLQPWGVLPLKTGIIEERLKRVEDLQRQDHEEILRLKTALELLKGSK